MNKPDILPMLPGQPVQGSQAATTPQSLVQQAAPTKAVSSQVVIPTASVRQQPDSSRQPVDTATYIDPYLFETGYYASQAEYDALSRAAASRLRLRADVENARPKQRKA